MASITYRIVQHDGGWAYQVDDVFSESLQTHDQARRAAERAAREQTLAGDSAAISYETADGIWHEEFAAGDDRPTTGVEG